MEQLRAVGRADGVGQVVLVHDVEMSFSGLGAEPVELVTLCRRIVSRQPSVGALWTLCARVLCSPEPIDTAWAFVEELDGTDRTSLASTILTLTEVLAVRSVAEGIETEDQLTQLVELRCELGQGYHLGAPVEVEAFTELLDPTRAGDHRPGS